jgi:hypothetical protein
MVSHGLGFTIILGFIPRLQTGDGAQPLKINTGQSIVDTGSYSPEGALTWADQNKPKDGLLGDRIISSIGANFLALLRGGSIILRSSRAAEIFLNNYHNLVRIVSRNWEHYTDVSSDVVRNFAGRIYRYTGYAPTFPLAKAEDYKLHFYYGDTKAGETIKTNYNNYVGTPATDTVIYKEQITDTPTTTPREIMRRTIKIDGEQEFWIYNGTHFTRVKSTPEILTLSWNDQNTVTIREADIHLVHKDGADYIMDANGIRATFKDGVINMSTNSILATYKTGTINMNTTQVVTSLGNTSSTLTDSSGTLTNGAGTSFVSDTQTRITNGAHSVTITSTGVAIT